MDSLLHDLRFAFRTLRRSSGFALTAILTLAIGIGGSTTIFSVVNGVVLRPLPYPEPDRLVRLNNAWEGTPNGAVSPAEYFDYQDGLRSLTGLGAYASQDANLTGGDAPERVTGGYLSAGVFRVLGVAPAAGRVFTAEEDRPGSDAVAVLSHGLWTRRFGADPAVIGSRIVVDGAPRTVLGVMPEGFRLPDDLATGAVTELYLPLALDRAAVMNRGSHFLEAIGRLAPGATVESAAAEAARLAAGFVRDHPDEYPAQMRFTADAGPLADSIVGEAGPLLLMLLGAVGLVLLIACSNVASLLLARADRRQRELAVRAALGARRGRIVRQLFLESLLLALCAGAAGVLLAVWATTAVPLLAPPHLPRLDDVRVDPWVLAFALGASLLSALLFGLAPAWYAARSSIEAALREGGRGQIGGGRRQRLRSSLVAAEVAIAVVLLVGAGLLTRSVAALYAVDPGYRTDGVLTLSLSLPTGDYPDQAAVGAFYRAALDRLAAVPGVRAAGAVSNLPLTGTLGDLNFSIEGRDVGEGESKPRGDWQVVTPGYFQAVGMRLLRGRGIEPTDVAGAPGAAVINESLAALYWPGADPIGQRLLLGAGAGPGWVTVVGVVGDVRQSGLDAAPRPEYYLPHAQFSFWNDGGPMRSMSVVLRTGGDPMAVAGSAREEIRALDPNLPVAELRTLDEVRSDSAAQPRFLSLLLGVFSAMALLLAAVGIYGTLSYLVAQRTREFGIRMALGARASEIMRMVVGRGAVLAAAGAAVGIAAALLLSRLLASLLYGVTTTDTLTYTAAPALLLAVALVACWLPARRATRVDPMVALRGE